MGSTVAWSVHSVGVVVVWAVLVLGGGAAGAHVGAAKPFASRPVPVTYLQSAFVTDDPPAWFYASEELKRLRVRAVATRFDGGEVLNLNVDTAAGRADVRRLASAMRSYSREAGSFFYGFWSFPRLPGFFRPDDIAAQPTSWRACSLRADGSLWVRTPSLPEENESKIKFTGEYVDLTRPDAVEALLSGVRSVFRHDGPEDSCVGPLHGFIVLNEWMLSSNYESVWSPHEKEHDVPSPEAVIHPGPATHRALFTDGDPRYSFYQPPKRAVPLYSRSARDSFREFARRRGTAVDALPADRDEFLVDDAEVELPEWVAFADPADRRVWSLWEDWVYDTWTGFVEKLCREQVLAQRGNPDFAGILYFQLPGWYSLRTAGREPISYRSPGPDGRLIERRAVAADHPESDRLNPVVMGTDMERLLAGPWLAGMIHETTKSLHLVAGRPMSTANYDEFVETHERRDTWYLAQGALARRTCERHGKLFGAFARAQYFRGGDPLPPELFRRSFERTIPPLHPDIVATIGPWFVDRERLPENLRDVARGGTGELQDVWAECIDAYRAARRAAEPEENPP